MLACAAVTCNATIWVRCWGKEFSLSLWTQVDFCSAFSSVPQKGLHSTLLPISFLSPCWGLSRRWLKSLQMGMWQCAGIMQLSEVEVVAFSISSKCKKKICHLTPFISKQISCGRLLVWWTVSTGYRAEDIVHRYSIQNKFNCWCSA